MKLTVEQAERAKRAAQAYAYTTDNEQDDEAARILFALAQEAYEQALEEVTRETK